MKRVAAWALVAFSGTLTVMVVRELSSNALAMLIGVVMGALASLPLGLAVLLWSRRMTERSGRSADPRQPTPPVIVISPGGQVGRPPWGPMPSWYMPGGGMADRDVVEEAPKEVRVLGDLAEGPVRRAWDQWNEA